VAVIGKALDGFTLERRRVLLLPLWVREAGWTQSLLEGIQLLHNSGCVYVVTFCRENEPVEIFLRWEGVSE